MNYALLIFSAAVMAALWVGMTWIVVDFLARMVTRLELATAAPSARVGYASLYDELVDRLGLDPLAATERRG